MDAARLLAGLDAEQRRAVTDPSQPLCILAGAGSGKTRVLTRRIAFRADRGDLDPRYTLAITFTRRAASQLRSRLGSLGMRERPHAGTFHAIAWSQLRTWHTDQRRTMPALLGQKARFLKDLEGIGPIDPYELSNEIEWARARDLRPEGYEVAARQEDRRIAASYGHIASLMQEYDRAKRRKGVMDFDDIIERCADLFDSDPSFARSQRWRHRHLFVDEFQDVNPLQHRLLQGWLGDRLDLCVVGDPNQAIYRWNGADAGYLNQFSTHHPGSTTVDLTRNYRSSPQILHVARAALGGSSSRLLPHRSAGDVPTFRGYTSDIDEARAIAREARVLHAPGTRWDDQAVLVRTNAQMGLIERAFAREKIPFRSRTDDPLLTDPHVQAALREVAPAGTEQLQVVVSDLSALLAEAIDDGDDRARVQALDTLVRLAGELVFLQPDATGSDLRAWLRTTAGLDGPGARGDAVDILTFHAAKGLEWPVVHVAGLEDGLVPISRAKTPEAEAEERRLLHVAITRAETTLRLSWANQRSIRGKELDRRRSPYSPAIDVALAELRDLARTDPTAGLARAREGLSRPDRTDEQRLRDALRRWRAEVARAADVPPAVVLSDRVLSDLAHTRPLDEDALAEVRGVGPSTLAAHGDALLRIVSDHVPARP